MRRDVKICLAGSLLILFVLLQGCSTFGPRFETPSINITSLELMESQGLSQRFKIGLVLTNPNAVALPIHGMSYTLSLNGFKLINGVSNDLPKVAAYSEVPITLEASTDLFAALRFLNSLASESARDMLQYQLDAKIDFKGLRPVMNVRHDGVIQLQQK